MILAMTPILGKLRLINYTVDTSYTLLCSTLGAGDGAMKASQGPPSKVLLLSPVSCYSASSMQLGEPPRWLLLWGQ